MFCLFFCLLSIGIIRLEDGTKIDDIPGGHLIQPKIEDIKSRHMISARTQKMPSGTYEPHLKNHRIGQI